ncbi:MAG: conserved exported protein of unknown function [Nitrospira sp.]|nr:DUF3015 family protein [Nitrospira sp.]ULA60319.1 MAG: conserved exported protein of unknown function [Nitrospira sp.]
MTGTRRSLIAAVSGLSLLALLSACSFKATFKETTDTTSNITGTTSGRIWWNEDGLLKSEHKMAAFTAYNAENVEADAARGHGEYLASLDALADLSEAAAFQPAAQAAFSRWSQAGSLSATELVKALQAAHR